MYSVHLDHDCNDVVLGRGDSLLLGPQMCDALQKRRALKKDKRGGQACLLVHKSAEEGSVPWTESIRSHTCSLAKAKIGDLSALRQQLNSRLSRDCMHEPGL